MRILNGVLLLQTAAALIASRNHVSVLRLAEPRTSPASFHLSRRPTKSSIAMHFGHSHSHTHSVVGESLTAPKEPKSWRERLFALVPKRRESGRIAFAALVTLLPAILRRRQLLIHSTEWAAFGLIATTLSLSDRIRFSVKSAIRKFQQLGQGIQKHAPQRGSSGAINEADRVTWIGVVVNLLLSVAKFIVGVTAHSSALLADAAHSLSDLFSDGITLWAVQLGRLPPDEDHPYGHGKFEAIGSLFLALTLLGTGVGVGFSSYQSLMQILQSGGAAAMSTVQAPGPIALLMALVSILSKEWLFRITRKVGLKLNSQVVMANAWHHRSDAYSSVLALVSIALARRGWLAADAAAGLLVGGMIGLTGFEIMGESLKQLTDTNEVSWIEPVTKIVEDEPDVLEVESIRARQVGSSTLIDVDVITKSDSLSTSALRTIEERLKWRLMTSFRNVHARVHASDKEVICPLLTATTLDSGYHGHNTTHSHSHSHDHSAENDVSLSTVEDIQEEVREILSSSAVPRVVVKFKETLHVHVDVVMQLDSNMNLEEARAHVKECQEKLLASPRLHSAQILLDLNVPAATSVKKSTGLAP